MTSRHKNSRWIAVLAIAALTATAAVATACGGGDDDNGDGNGAVTPPAQTPAVSATEPAAEPTAPEAGETAPAGDGPTLSTAEDPALGTILVGPDGLTLYTFTNDTAGSGESACYDNCAAAWPPLTVDGEPSAGDGVTGQLATIERTDGTTQVTYNGTPLYYFASDSAPGDTNGHEVGGVWFVAEP